MKLMKVAFVVVLAVILCSCKVSSHLHPLILVPGSLGSPIEGRLTDEYVPTSPSCGRDIPSIKDEDGWFRLWLDFKAIVSSSKSLECIAERLTLHYSIDVDDYINAPGVETRAPQLGSTEPLLFIDPAAKFITEYMNSLVKSLQKIGYEDGKTLFGALYDFRYGLAAQGHPCSVGSKFLGDLKGLIEEASTSNGGKPVILLSHSLGGLYVQQLLIRNPPSWRQKYVKHFVAVAAPWGGTLKALLTLTSGNALGVPLVDPLLVSGEQRSCESNLWLMPNPKLFGRSKSLVITPNATYTAWDIPRFLEDMGFPEGVFPYETRVLPLIERLEAPGVPVTCVIGTGVKTLETLFYDERGFDQQPKVVYGDGDGTVNMASLLAVESEWQDVGNQTLKFIKVPGVSHTSLLKNDVALNELIGEIKTINYEIVLPLESLKGDHQARI